MQANIVKLLWVGRLKYGPSLQLQKILSSLHHKQSDNGICNTLLLVEHDPVYTIGIRSKKYTEEDEKKLKNLGAEFYKTDRGGLITFHGPGQLVAYPILNLKQFKPSVKWYISQIEQMIIRLCAEFGIIGATTSDTGVWVNDKKICAIGVHGSRYITTHGLALNCNTDLTWFNHIVPCGIEGKGVTSISKELDVNVTIENVLPKFEKIFAETFQCSLVLYPPNEAEKLLLNIKNNKSI